MIFRFHPAFLLFVLQLFPLTVTACFCYPFLVVSGVLVLLSTVEQSVRTIIISPSK